MNTQLWQVIDIEENPDHVIANVVNVPDSLQGHTIRQVLEMADFPYHADNTHILPAQKPDAEALNINWDVICDLVRENLATMKSDALEAKADTSGQAGSDTLLSASREKPS